MDALSRRFDSLLLLAAFIAASTIGCKQEQNTVVVAPPVSYNTPVVASALNSFSYVIYAQQYSGSSSQDLTFNSDSLSVALTVGSYSGGLARLSVTDSLGRSAYADTITGNKIVALSDLKTYAPRRFAITCTNFTGSMTVALAAIVRR
jgi:hypothetical protein